jgi:hypothetical protein
VNLDDRGDSIDLVRVKFLTPTELKGSHHWPEQASFETLACRIRDRISTLRQLYGAGPLAIDFGKFAEAAARVEVRSAHLLRQDAMRRSSRSGLQHSIGGVTGEVVYGGSLASFMPYLQAARWTGVGRQTVGGKGELATEPLSN